MSQTRNELIEFLKNNPHAQVIAVHETTTGTSVILNVNEDEFFLEGISSILASYARVTYEEHPDTPHPDMEGLDELQKQRILGMTLLFAKCFVNERPEVKAHAMTALIGSMNVLMRTGTPVPEVVQLYKASAAMAGKNPLGATVDDGKPQFH